MLETLSPELIRRLDVAAPRYTSYPTVPEWSSSFGSAEYSAALARAGRSDAPLSLYVHIPFCREMCTYCGCNVVVTTSTEKHDRYLDSLASELARVAERLQGRRALSRLHLGGGTPTSFDVDRLQRLVTLIRGNFDILPDAELAIEIDPVVTSDEQLAFLASAGWTRLSMGVQDFDPGVQEAVNRRQSVEETQHAIETARKLGFTSVNLDLIYGLPRQRPETWQRTLREVAALRPDRVACFSFAYVPKMKPHQRRLPVADMPSGPDKLALFLLAHETLSEAGYRAIGMDHFALPQDELAQAQERGVLWRDFQGYTVLRASDTVGVGASAISSIGGAYAQSSHVLSAWSAALEAGRLPVERGHLLSADDERRRAVITQIMCNFTIDLGPQGAQELAPELRALASLEDEGLVKVTGTRIDVTPRGRFFVRNVALVFDAYLARRTAGDRPLYSRTV